MPRKDNRTTELESVNPDERHAFLREIFMYGHLELLTVQDIQFLSRNELERRLRTNKVTEQFFGQLLAQIPDAHIKFGMLSESYQKTRNRRLFFSEPRVFQAYLGVKDLPLLTSDDQGRILLMTSLPEQLLQLEHSRFWEQWVKFCETHLTIST